MPMGFKLKNTAEYLDKRGDTNWWKWKAYIEATQPNTLADIKYVEYHLHPSFRDPVQRIRLKYGGFPLNQVGWGTFSLKAKLVFEDPSKEDLILEHYLDFST